MPDENDGTQIESIVVRLDEPSPPSATDSVVENWFDSHIRGSIAAQSTAVWNHLMAAKERLKEMLR